MVKISALIVLGALACASAARVPDDLFMSSDTATGSLRSSALGMLGLMREVANHKDERAIASIRFFVPPGEHKHFEDIWLDLEKDVEDEEKHVQIFDLKKTHADNLIYYSYGQWDSHEDLRDHLLSKHFEDFADEVEEHEVRWELQLLKSLSSEFEHKHAQRTNTEAKVEKTRGLHHILITYIVPPGEGKGFTDAWSDNADATLDEKRNRNYALRKVVTDNSRYYSYGTWDSLSDWLDHYESKHFGDFLDFVDKKDIVYFIQPLIKIGNESE